MEDDNGVYLCGFKDATVLNNGCDGTEVAGTKCTIANGRTNTINLPGCADNGATGEKLKFILKVVYYKGSATDFTHTLEGDLLTTIEP